MFKKFFFACVSSILICTYLVGCGNAEHHIQMVTDGNDQVGTPESNEKNLTVQFMNVGHGDCTLIVNGNHCMMIDTGAVLAKDCVSSGIEELKKCGIEQLDYLVLTHPDKDHIGGAEDVLREIPVKQVLLSDYYKDSEMQDDLMRCLAMQPDIEVVIPESGEVYEFGKASFQIIGPSADAEDSNNSSIIVRMDYGKRHFLFMGDAEKEGELAAMETGLSLQADVLKVGHHGRSDASKKEFLKAVHPEIAVISGNREQEPEDAADKVLKRLSKEEATVYFTEVNGTVTIETDGEYLNIVTER